MLPAAPHREELQERDIYQEGKGCSWWKGSAMGRPTCSWTEVKRKAYHKAAQALRRAANGDKPAKKRQFRMCTNPSHESSSGRSKGKNVQYIWCRDCFSEARDINNLEQAQPSQRFVFCQAKFCLNILGEPQQARNCGCAQPSKKASE